MAEVECFSRLAAVRCQRLSDNQHIVVYLPTGLGILLVPVLLALTWRRPRATIIFLAIDILLGGAVGTWHLLVSLIPPSSDSFQSQDLALGAISALPILFSLLFANSILISDIRPCLPNIMQNNVSALVLSCLIVPLIPVAFVGTLLGSVLFIVYCKSASVSIGFERMPQRQLNEVLSLVGIAAATAFFVLVFGLTLLVVLNQQSRARWLLDYPSLPALALISLGLGLQSLSLALGLAQESFAIIVVRRVLELASRATLTIGLVQSYYPLRKQTKESRPGRERPQRQGARSISNPVAGSLLKMDTSATQSFHQRASRGPGQSTGFHDRVVSRYSPHRGPALSFTPSTFDQSNLSSLADEVRNRERLIQESISMNERMTQNPFLSPQEQQDRYRVKKNVGSIYRPKLVPVSEGELSQWPPIQETPAPVQSGFPLPPPRTLLADIPKALTPTGSLDREALSARLSPGERVGQVTAFQAGDTLHPTPERHVSSRRKPVRSDWDRHSPNQSMEGVLSFISTSTTPAPPGSPTVSPSAEAAWDDTLRSSIPRRLRRRETDPTRAVMTRSIGEDSSVYSQASPQATDFGLFYRAPLSSPSSTSPDKSTYQRGSRVPSLPKSPLQPATDAKLALSSLDRVRRDTGVDLGVVGLSPPPEIRASSSGSDGQQGLDRLSTTTWTSDDVTPRVSERGWWGNVRPDD